MAKNLVIFYQDNARVHTCAVSMAKLYELGNELVPYPPYSPDLAPSDYFLFSNLKKWLGGKTFSSNDEIIDQTNAHFKDLEKSYFFEGIQKLEKRRTKCIELKGDYVEKQIFVLQKTLCFIPKSHGLIDPRSYVYFYSVSNFITKI